jgi:hypothetical protein
MKDPREEQPKWMIHRCKIPDTTGAECGFFKRYRILPKDPKGLPTDPKEFTEYVSRRIGATYRDWLDTHLKHAHPNEQQDMANAITLAAQYVMVKRLRPLMESQRE